jgi:integrase
MAHLTKRFIESISAPQSRYTIVWDDELKGFGVRVMASGIKTYIVNYCTHTGRQRRMSIGRCNVLVPDRARKEAVRILGEVALGGDPLGERRRVRHESSFRFLASEYLKRHAVHKKSGDEDRRIIEKDLLPVLGSCHLSEITRRDVLRLINGIKDRGAPIMANRTLTLIRTIFNFGIQQAITETNPTMGIKLPSRERRRERVLSEEEIVGFWSVLPRANINETVARVLKMVLVTAQRPGEVAGAEWSEIDLVMGWWTIPAEKSKNGLTHRVPLSQMALGILERCPRTTTHLFPAPRSRWKPIGINYLSHALRLKREALGMEHFTPHDLRRTAASRMASMGIPRLVISKVLNHVERGITAVYDRHGYDREKRAALDAWATQLENIIAGGKSAVLPITNPWLARERGNYLFKKAI